MAIDNNDVSILWDSFGKLHVDIQERRILCNQMQESAETPAEEHLLDGLRSKLGEMDQILNQANVFIKDYAPRNEPVMPNSPRVKNKPTDTFGGSSYDSLRGAPRDGGR